VDILDGGAVVASHERAVGRFVEVLELDHYLEVLRRKPGALPGATALAQAKTAGTFTSAHQQYWDSVRAARGDAKGTRALVTAMHAALERGVLDPASVIIDARRDATAPIAAVIDIGALARYDRPAPTLTAYDDLLTRSTS
jgi:hypothetical protein